MQTDGIINRFKKLMNLERYWIFAGFVIILINYSPYLILGDKAYYPVFGDQIDELCAFNFRSIKEIFASNDYLIPWIGNGVPRVLFPSEFNVIVWLIFIFGITKTIILVSISASFVAFIGTWLFLKEHFFPYLSQKFNIIFGQNLFYLMLFIPSVYNGLRPIWVPGIFSVPGQMLVLYALLNLLKNRSHIRNWIIIIFYSFTSLFLYHNIFFVTALFVLFILLVILKKRFVWNVFIGLFLIVLIGIIIEYRLFSNIIHPIVKINRSEVFLGEINRNLSILKHIKEVILFCILSTKHFLTYYIMSYGINNSAMHNLLIVILFFLTFSLLFFLKEYKKILILFSFLFLGWTINGLTYDVALLKLLLCKTLPFLSTTIKSMSIRFNLLINIFWSSFLFFTLFILLSLKKIYNLSLILSESFLVFFLIYHFSLYRVSYDDIFDEPFAFTNNYIEKLNNEISFYSLLDTKLYSIIKNDILIKKGLKVNEYNVINLIFLEPDQKKFNKQKIIHSHLYLSIWATLNDFQTYDGYLPIWPKEKVDLYKSITNCNTNCNYRKHYFFPSSVNNDKYYLNYNFDLLKKENVKFIFSPKEIENTNLKFFGKYKGLSKTLYVYEIP